jgi:hypothetical protein
LPEPPDEPFVSAFALSLDLPDRLLVRVHVSADERYELYVDGQRLGRGPERGDEDNWAFDTYDVDLAAGSHTLVAKVSWLGPDAAFAQHTVQPAFIFCPQDEAYTSLLATGTAPWKVKRIGGYSFKNPQAAWGTGANLEIHGQEFDWNFTNGATEEWLDPVTIHPGESSAYPGDRGRTPLLRPAMLPPMMERALPIGKVRNVSTPPPGPTHGVPIRQTDHLNAEAAKWQSLLDQRSPVEFAPHSRRRILIDLDDYYCAYPELVTSGGAGASVRVHWQEALYEKDGETPKGNRDEIEGKYFTTVWHWQDGIGDTFFPDGGENRLFETLWWQCGRYVEVLVETNDEPLTLERLAFRETRYPVENKSTFRASDPRLERITPIAVRSLQMCSHETFMDCPYFEQLQYVGDTRLQALVTYAITPDDRLPRQALQAFDWSRQTSGITQSRYPSRVRQLIPPFSLWWVCMVHDYAMWRDDLRFVNERMPGVHAVLDYFRQSIGADGLLEPPRGWNFVDWVPGWESGAPPTALTSPVAPLNLQFVLALRKAALLEDIMGDTEMAVRYRKLAARLQEAIRRSFWNPGRGMFADDLGHRHFSEHSQLLAILTATSDDPRVVEGLLNAPDLARTTIYFSHYLFEAFGQLGLGEEIIKRLDQWHELVENGLRTTIEHPEPTRSDCHAWGAHPQFHFLATILGIRPGSPGFATVHIVPSLGSLTFAEGSMPHPKGDIRVAIHRTEGRTTAKVDLPEGVSGTLSISGQKISLGNGEQAFDLVDSA